MSTDRIDQAALVALALAELRALWPQLRPAIAADGAGPNAERIRSGTSVDPPPAVNEDVLTTIIDIESDATSRYDEIRRILGLRHRPAGIVTVLDELEMHRTELARKWPILIDDLDQAIFRWQRSARSALKLITAPRRLRLLCPYHRPTDPTQLERTGDQAELHAAIIGGAPQALVTRVLNNVATLPSEPALKWSASDTLRCPHCRAQWTGMAELVELADLMKKAEASQ